MSEDGGSVVSSTGPTPWYERLLFGLDAFGLGGHWFDRLDRVRDGASAGWLLVWDWIALCALPFAVVWFTWRAVRPGPRRAEPSTPAGRGRT
jgi:hypothetical protein